MTAPGEHGHADVTGTAAVPGAAAEAAATGTPRTLGGQEAWERLLRVRTREEAAGAGLEQGTDGGWRWRVPASPDAGVLASLYTPLCLAGAECAFAQLGQSIDGFIATRTGHSNYVTGEEDRLHLHRLRALSDAVLVGAGTTIADDPRLTVRACTGGNPVRVVLDPRGRAWESSRDAQVFTDGQAPTLHVIGTDAPAGTEAASSSGASSSGASLSGGASGGASGVEVLRLPRGEGGFEPRTLLDALAQRGLRRVMVEGGGATVSGFLRADVLDRLYVTVAPVVIGDGVPGLRFPGPVRMGEALRPPTRVFPLGEDVLFELDLLAA
ncbi:RibD family protein [Streptomyces sp. WMMB 714]|uniref:RibD family protein n=1 Tax=Streptomyces sp. WMMB 714 TaxID=1286822 RepID=UPI0020C7BDDD|nr:RibD family protein [Streptomyces sp. WMMB 714]